jgi:hypothetical protein
VRPEDFGSWLAIDHVAVLQRNYTITNVGFKAGAVEPQLLNALNHVLNEHAAKVVKRTRYFSGWCAASSGHCTTRFFRRQIGSITGRILSQWATEDC